MTLEAAETVVAGTGHIYVATVGTAMPAGIDSAPAGAPWHELGYSTPDGVSFEFARETKDIFAWQTRDPIRTLNLAQPKTIKFSLMQWNQHTFDVAVGGGEWVEGTSDQYEFTPAAASFVNEKALIVEFTDDTKNYRFCFPRVLNKEPFTFSTLPEDTANLPIGMSVLDPGVGVAAYTFQTDDINLGEVAQAGS